MPYGRQVLGSTGFAIMLASDGRPEWKTAGITIDWSTVAAVTGADLVLPDGLTIKVGQKGVRYGQVWAKITASGLFGPYDPAAADGRQTLVRGNTFLQNQSLLQTGLLGYAQQVTDIIGVLEGGQVWYDRVLATTGAASLAAGPTFTALEAALPRLSYAKN